MKPERKAGNETDQDNINDTLGQITKYCKWTWGRCKKLALILIE